MIFVDAMLNQVTFTAELDSQV